MKITFSWTWVLLLGAAIISFSPTLVKLVTGIGPSAIGAWRCGLGFLILVPWILYEHFIQKRKILFNRGSLPAWGWMILAGFVFSLDLFAWNHSIFLSGSGIATILTNTQSIYLGLVGILLAKEKVSWSFIIALPMAVVGILLMAAIDSPNAHEEARYIQGILYGVMTGFFYACYLLCMRRLEKYKSKYNFSLAQKIAFVSLFTSLFMWPMAMVADEALIPSLQDFIYLVIMAAITHSLGWYIITRSLPFVPIAISGLLMTTQPLLAFVWGALLLNEHLQFLQMAGIGLTLLAIYLGLRKN